MDDFRNICDVSSNPRPVPMMSPIQFDGNLDSNYFSPIPNQMQTSPDVFWQYTADHRQSPYPNPYPCNNIGQQCTYWRNSPYPTADQMLMPREWSNPSPDSCSYQFSTGSLETIPVQNMSMHAMNHGIPQWPTGRANCDFSNSADSSLSEIVMSVYGDYNTSRDDQGCIDHEMNYQNTNEMNGLNQGLRHTSTPLTDVLTEERYNSCRLQTSDQSIQTGFKLKDKSKALKRERPADISQAKPKAKRDKKTSSHDTKKKRNSRSMSRKPEAYKRQKKLQREREGKIRSAIQELSSILPNDDDQKKWSKNIILVKAIEHIYQLKMKLGDRTVKEVEQSMSEVNSSGDSKHGGRKKPKEKREPKKKKVSSTTKKQTNKSTKSNSQSKSTPNFTTIIVPQKSKPPSSTSSEHGSLLTDLLTPSDSSIGSDSLESSCTDDGNYDYCSHIKRPMNAFMLFSKANREKFKKLYPGRDNRQISTKLGEYWKAMDKEEKLPFQDMARELMRKTKETYPDFKYSPTDQQKNDSDGCSREGSPRKDFRVGSHILRNRLSREKDKELKSYAANLLNGKPEDTNNTTKPPEQPNYQVVMPRARHIQADHTGAGYGYLVQCDKCSKWRRLSDGVSPAALPDKWFCWLSTDPNIFDCSTNEEIKVNVD